MSDEDARYDSDDAGSHNEGETDSDEDIRGDVPLAVRVASLHAEFAHAASVSDAEGSSDSDDAESADAESEDDLAVVLKRPATVQESADAESVDDLAVVLKRPATVQQSLQCKGLNCVFARTNPGSPARAEKSANGLCMFCDPVKLKDSQSTTGGRGNITMSLRSFAEKAPEVYQRALGLLPPGYAFGTRYCTDAACVYSQKRPGERARATLGHNRCMWCDPQQLRASEGTLGGQMNIAQSLNCFLVKPAVAEAAWGKLSAEYQELPAKRKAQRKERRRQLELDRESEARESKRMRLEDPLVAQQDEERRERHAMGKDDELSHRYERERAAFESEDYLAHAQPGRPAKPWTVLGEYAACEHFIEWRCPLNSATKPERPACRYCAHGYRRDDPPPVCRYDRDSTPGKSWKPMAHVTQLLRNFAYNAESECPDDLMPDLLYDHPAALSPAGQLAQSRLRKWESEYRRWQDWQKLLNKESDSEDANSLSTRKGKARIYARFKEGWGRERAKGDLLDGLSD